MAIKVGINEAVTNNKLNYPVLRIWNKPGEEGMSVVLFISLTQGISLKSINNTVGEVSTWVDATDQYWIPGEITLSSVN